MLSWHVGSFHAFILFQFTSVQLTKNSYKQTGSDSRYSHVLFSKLPVHGATWYH